MEEISVTTTTTVTMDPDRVEPEPALLRVRLADSLPTDASQSPKTAEAAPAGPTRPDCVVYTSLASHWRRNWLPTAAAADGAGLSGNHHWLRRIKWELKVLAEALPPTDSPLSIRVLVDTDRLDLMKAIIPGPEGTPYAHGLFEFDLHLPMRYPAVPPEVLFRTTGQGKARLNPNLYACGKVCLSLLGTWSGPGWQGEQSTLLQLLLSLQALVLNTNPLANEPGMHVGPTSPEAARYNQGVRLATMNYAVLSHLNTPTPDIEPIVREYYTTHRDVVADNIKKWMEIPETPGYLHYDIDGSTFSYRTYQDTAKTVLRALTCDQSNPSATAAGEATATLHPPTLTTKKGVTGTETMPSPSAALKTLEAVM